LAADGVVLCRRICGSIKINTKILNVITRSILAVALAILATLNTFAQQNEQDRSWNQPVEPFRIAGNIYYVGASDITSYLITTPKGHILIDSGFLETVPQIRVNVAKLGFRLEDVKFLLNSHAHYDHAGGLAELRRLTKAKLLVSEPDSDLMANGGKGDPNFGDRFPFEGVRADETFRDGKKIKLGGVTLTANITSGHTRGCTTWTTETKDQGRTLKAVFVCSTSAPGYKLVGNEKYPNIYADYQATFARLERLQPDIFLSAHGAQFDLQGKIERMKAGAGNPFIDAAGYRRYLKESREAVESTHKRQSAP
jgi:metallo-beta-lactamase class B